MPSARRRRARASRRSWRRTVLVTVLVAFGLIVVVGSLAEIHAQSRSYRSSTDAGYAAMATRVVQESNRTGQQLATVIAGAPSTPNTFLGSATRPTGILRSARAVVQVGLDQAVQDSGQEEAQAAALEPPAPTGGIGGRLTQVLADRATATREVRTDIDALLGMSPLPVAGASTPTAPPTPTALLSPDQASARLAAAGQLFAQSDAAYRSLVVAGRSQPTPIRLPASVWVGPPNGAAALGPSSLSATATALSDSVPLHPFHRLIITAVGLSPPAIASGGPGTVPGPSGNSCVDPRSTVPGSLPTVLPPTTSVSAAVTVTNCGTVDEPRVRITQTLTVSDPAGTAPPPAAFDGGQSAVTVDIAAGASVAVTPPAARLVTGHLYTLSLTVSPAVPTGPALSGATQTFRIRVAP